MPVELVPAANTLNLTLFGFGVLVGPLLVGLLIPIIGLEWLYLLDAITLVVVLYAIYRLPPIPPLGVITQRAKVLDGLRFLRTRQLLLMTFVVDIIAMVFGLPRALFPQMAEETFGGPAGGGPQLGLLNAGMAIGVLLGGLTGGWIHRVHRQGVAIVIAILRLGRGDGAARYDIGAVVRRGAARRRRVGRHGRRPRTARRFCRSRPTDEHARPACRASSPSSWPVVRGWPTSCTDWSPASTAPRSP